MEGKVGKPDITGKSNECVVEFGVRLQLLFVTSRCHPDHKCCHLCVILQYSSVMCFKVVFLHFIPRADQEERTKAIEAFKEGKKDVLVATDVASKGLDFPAIQHVVNYDMPEEIENYGKQLLV